MDTVRPTRGNGADRDERTPAVRARVSATTGAAVPGVVGEAGGAGVPAACRVSDALAGHLAALGPEVKARREPDGQITLTMPETWACACLSAGRALFETMREAMRRADTQARGRAAEEYVRSGAPAAAWEREQAAIFAEYRRLVEGGLPHREALHRLKQGAGERFTVTDLEEAVRAQGAKVRRAERAARAARIREGAGRALTVEEVAAREGLSVGSVKACLRRGSVPDRPRGARAEQRARRAAILALHAEGLMPAAIVERLGVTWPQVMGAIQGVPRGTARLRVSAGG